MQHGFDSRTDCMKDVEITKVLDHDVSISFSEGKWYLWSETFQEYAYGETAEEMMKDYLSSLKDLILIYGIEDDKKLSSGAVEFKRKINPFLEYNIIKE